MLRTSEGADANGAKARPITFLPYQTQPIPRIESGSPLGAVDETSEARTNDGDGLIGQGNGDYRAQAGGSAIPCRASATTAFQYRQP